MTSVCVAGWGMMNCYDIVSVSRRQHVQAPAAREMVGVAADIYGSTTLTLTNLVVGSRYRFEVAATGALAEPTANAVGVAAASDVDITLDYYAPGNSLNAVRAKVRNASSSPKYKPWETQAVLSKTPQSVFVSQQED